jgi:hypothetical protein
MIVMPLTGQLEIILAAARSAFGEAAQTLEEIAVCEPLICRKWVPAPFNW